MLKNKKNVIILLLLIAIMLQENTCYAQKFGYADLEYILNQMPEFKTAQAQLDALTKEWQNEVEEKLKKVDLYIKKNQAEKVLLTDAMKKTRELKIKSLQKDAYDRQTKIFGPKGLLFLKRQELIVPLRKKVFYTVEKIAKKNKYQMVFDKSAGLVLIYTDPNFDITNKILEDLGLRKEKNDENNNEVNN